jgi:DNA-binding MarR family transcriptional regulator
MSAPKTKLSGRRLTKGDYEALAQFRYQLRRFLRFSEEVTHDSGITPLQYQLLLQLKGFPGRDWATVTELAERLQAKHHGVVALVSRSEALGLVQRQASPSDLRRVEVRLTGEGERCIDQLARLHRAELQSLQDMLQESALAVTRGAG